MVISLLLDGGQSLLNLNSQQTGVIVTTLVLFNHNSLLGRLWLLLLLGNDDLSLLSLNWRRLFGLGWRVDLLLGDGLVLLDFRNVISILLLDGLVDAVQSILTNLVVELDLSDCRQVLSSLEELLNLLVSKSSSEVSLHEDAVV